jgi:hypothetical protein
MTPTPRRTGVLTIDAPDKAPLTLDPNRWFYRETSPSPGGMRMNHVDYVPDVDTKTVTVHYEGGHRCLLTGRDAWLFLRIMRDKNAPNFELA